MGLFKDGLGGYSSRYLRITVSGSSLNLILSSALHSYDSERYLF